MVDAESQVFVLNSKVVASAVQRLRKTKIHPHFAGYLCIKRTCRIAGTTVDLRPNFLDFFVEYLRPSDGEENKPFIRPFKENGDPASDVWANKNVAGSYAPSSLRGVAPFRKVVDVIGGGASAKYSLFADYPNLALEHLLFGKKLSIVWLAVFLYRDFGFSDANPTISDLVKLFQDDFDFANEDEFSKIFDLELGELEDIAPHFLPFVKENVLSDAK
jgi:hypothetical protein